MHFGNDPKPGDNTTSPIFVENDEYVVNRNAARKFKPMLDTLNFVVEPRFDNEDTAHSAIDEAIAMNFLSEMGMQEGGEVKSKIHKYLAHGDKVSNMRAYANPEDSTVFYQHRFQPFLYDREGSLSGFVDDKGGKHFHTNDKLLKLAESLSDDNFDYSNIGAIENPYFDREGKKYADFKFPGRQEGGQLKSIPTGNKGLSKLPENVRNKMGYMQEGGEVEDKRDRKGGYSLGVKDYYAQALGEFEKMGDFVGGATGSNRRAILEAAQEAGEIMETQEALDALQMIMDRHQQGTMNVMANPRQGYQYGGMTENQLYEQFGGRLTYGADREDFKKAYGTPDVSSFLEARETMGARGRQDLKNIRQQQAGALFQDPTATTQAYQSYETGTQRALDQALEQSELDALSYLADVEAGGASFDEGYTAPTQPVNAPRAGQRGFSAGASSPDGSFTFPQYDPFTENNTFTAPNGNVFNWDTTQNQWIRAS